MLTGWVGGPRAWKLMNMGTEAILETALDTLARHLSLARRTLGGLLTGFWMHDWLGDPYARGAYSYPIVGGSAAAKVLARPVQGTLFFAGGLQPPLLVAAPQQPIRHARHLGVDDVVDPAAGNAGAGTTAAGLRCGTPAVPVPVQLDQHFWAARLHTLGVAPRPLRYQRLTAPRLADAVTTAVHSSALRTRARALAAALAREDGGRQVVAALDRLN